MAASTATEKTPVSSSSSSSSHLKFHNQPIKSKRRKCRETTISAAVTTTKSHLSSASSSSTSSASSSTRKLDRPTIVSPDNSWCCSSVSKPICTPPPPPPPPPALPRWNLISPSDSSYPFRIRFSPGSQSPVMDFTSSSSPTTTAGNVNGHHEYFPSSFSKFNSALNVGLINPMSSPPPSPEKTRSSPTLLEMMVNEPDIHPKTQIPPQHGGLSAPKIQISPQYKQPLSMHRISELSQSRNPGNNFNDPVNSDIKLTLNSKDGISVSMNVLKNLEATPWAEEEEEKVASLLSELHVEGAGESEVLKRVSIEVTNGPEENSEKNEGVLLKLLQVVLEGKDEKATREMKLLVSKMLRENPSFNELEKESLYIASDGCLQLLRTHLFRAANSDLKEVEQIARQSDNLYWLLDILIDQQIGEDFLKTWASQSELSKIHSKIPAVHRFEISKITARFFIGIGKGQILASKDVRFLLLKTWLDPFYDDFGWMRRGSKGIDRHLIEDGLSNTILTLPLAWQQEILLGWFDRFMRCSEDCPNIQRGFEVWWRRAFWRRGLEQDRTRPLKINTSTIENS